MDEEETGGGRHFEKTSSLDLQLSPDLLDSVVLDDAKSDLGENGEESMEVTTDQIETLYHLTGEFRKRAFPLAPVLPPFLSGSLTCLFTLYYLLYYM